MSSVLIIDDEPNIRRMVGALLSSEGYEVRDAAEGAVGLSRVAESCPDAVLLDLMMPGELDGLATLARLREQVPDVPVIMMSGKAGLSDAVKATKLGAFNFLEKPLTPEGVLLALASALELRRVRREARALREDLGLAGEMIGGSPAMERVREMIARVAPTDARVLITGESGTGKELVASAIHFGSARKDRPFVRVNCAAIPRDLVESEMFGHEKGSFTGATERRIGRFELAHTGTLFLDEVGDLGLEAQAKLLRAIEAREIERVGGMHPIKTDLRLIAATNIDLRQAVREGKFREDLFYRLNVITIDLPPLRSRREDIPLLVNHFLEFYTNENGMAQRRLSADALRALVDYEWPGNVRELENSIERGVVLSSGPMIGSELLPGHITGRSFQDALLEHNPNASLFDILEDIERRIIIEKLERCNWNQTDAAEQFHIPLSTLNQKIKRLNIEIRKRNRE